MNQDDSKQWEYLLNQESDPTWSDLTLMSLQTISRQSRRLHPRAEIPKKATRVAEADEHENGRSWALIPSTLAEQHTWMLFKLQK